MDISSPVTSDEEYLSPLEEAVDFGVQDPKQTIDTRFRKPPAFQVRLHRANLKLNLLFILEDDLIMFSIYIYLL